MRHRHTGFAFSEPRGVDLSLGTVWMNNLSKKLSERFIDKWEDEMRFD